MRRRGEDRGRCGGRDSVVAWVLVSPGHRALRPAAVDRVPTFALVLDAAPAAVQVARADLGAFAACHGASADVRRRLALAVTEAAANVVNHAYPEGGRGSLRLIADVLDGALEVLVADQGAGMRSGVASDGLGLGLALIAEVTDACSIDSGTPRGTEVWMRFLLG